MVLKHRVFHGLHNIAGVPASLAAYERALGLDSKAVCFGNTFQSERISEVVNYDPSDRIRYYLDNFDIFNFHFGSSLFGQSLGDLEILKSAGKKVILHYHGCDIRDSKLVLERHRISACAECWPISCSANRTVSREIRREMSDLITVTTPDLLEFEPRAIWLPQAVDLAHVRKLAASATPAFRRKTNVRGNKADDTVYIVHAPSASRLKGSRFLEDAVQNLKRAGVKVELVFLSGVGHDVVMASLREADLVVDQLLVGAYGVLAVEAMALGKPTLAYIRDDLRECFPPELPIVNCRIDRLEEDLLKIIEDRRKWKEIGARSVSYAENFHQGLVVAKKLVEYYEKL
ncbi:glycosyltransferase [Microvirga sp. 17 mud 1-3]|uniref:glycosyltransferase n=1 Tax=Microvirga sp. 17 mud 1-3 TaxID=2082949 RepID=UPI0013A5484A|nr:glycosyltransferase [Microvirga sp. 17 mud 1-3]